MSRIARDMSMRERLALLALAVMLPFVALHAYVVWRHIDRDTEQAYTRVQRYAVMAAADTRHFLTDTAAALTRLANDREVQQADGEACRRTLATMVHGNPNFASASVVSLPYGAVLCSSLPPARGRSGQIAPRGFSRAIARSTGFANSSPFFDPMRQHWMMAFAYPVRQHSGGPSALIVTVDLIAGAGLHCRTSLAGESLAPGSTTTLVDGHDGRVLMRWPDPGRWIGTRPAGAPIVDYVLRGRGDGHAVSRGIDGRERLYGFASIPDTDWHVYVGVPTSAAVAPAHAFMWRDTILGLAVTLIVTALAMVLGTSIVRPIRALGRAAHIAKAGDLQSRAPEIGGREIHRAAHAFNELLDARQRAEAALAEEKRRAETTLHSIGDAVVRVDRDQRITYLNPAAEKLTGWNLADAIGRPMFEVVALVRESTHEAIRKSLDTALEEGAVVDLGGDTLLVARDGREFHVADSAAPLLDRDLGVMGAVLVFRDITETRELERRLSWQARHDGLTGLVNRVEFERRVVEALDDAKNNHTHHVVLYVDLDQFKVVNDTAGHLAGDELLRRLADILKAVTAPGHTVARVGGDEFCVLLRNESTTSAERVADDLRRRIEDFRFPWDGKTFGVGASIGLVGLDALSGSLEDVMKAADIACYSAKEGGRNRVHVFVPEDEAVRARLQEPEWVQRIGKALDEQRFRLYTQAIVPLANEPREPVLHEILVRMCDEKAHLLPPASFLPAAQRYNLVTALDRWVVSTALANISRSGSEAHFTINLSGHAISDDRFLAFVLEQFDTTGISPTHVCFEITESAAIVNLTRATHFMREVRARGARFALDDFGIGISSLAYLRSLPVDLLKIDGRFVRNIDRDHIDHAMVEAIVRIGRVMHLKTVAEFVENERTRTYVEALGVDYAQGYGVSEPQPIEYVLDGQALECRPA